MLNLLLILISKGLYLFQSLNVSYNSWRVGIAGPAPNLVIARNPALFPNTIASSKLAPYSILTANPPLKQSPAPVVSTNLRCG